MSKLQITDFITYRYRYLISYISIGLLLCALLYVAGVLIPGGISDSEMLAATKSSNLALGALVGGQPENVIHLPYRVLQAFSIHFFGMTIISIKLPSLLIAAISILLFYKVLRLWFRANVAIITTTILMTSSLFLLQAQLGTAGIMYLFWGILLLFSTSKMAQSKARSWIWLLMSATTAGLSLYSPYAIYIIIPLALAALIHPHARFVVFRQPFWAVVSSFVLFSIVVTPLLFALVEQPNVGLQLLVGKDIALGTYSFSGSITQLSQYLDFYNNHSGKILQPAYGLGLLMVALVGLAHLFAAKYTAKSYILALWLLLTLPVLFFNPDAASTSILPVMLLVAFAINFIIRRWYKMFPRNPYARIAGLFPLAILVIGLSISSLDRFVYGYNYNPDASSAYSSDLRLINDEVTKANGKIYLVVPKDQVSFYESFAKYSKHKTATVLVTNNVAKAVKSGTPIILNDTTMAKQIKSSPSKIITSGATDDANRVYLYKNSAS